MVPSSGATSAPEGEGAWQMRTLLLILPVKCHMGLFTYYVITEGEGGSSMITLHVIVTWVSTVKVITEGRGG